MHTGTLSKLTLVFPQWATCNGLLLGQPAVGYTAILAKFENLCDRLKKYLKIYVYFYSTLSNEIIHFIDGSGGHTNPSS